MGENVIFLKKVFLSILAFYIIIAVIPIKLVFLSSPIGKAFAGGEAQVDVSVHELVESMKCQEKAYQAIMKNSVNTKTPGYRELGVIVDKNGRVISYARYRQGTLVLTKNPLDLAIEGDGFFVIAGGDQAWYTRDGRFVINPDGVLVTLSGGYPVLGEGGPIVLPDATARIQISTGGKIYQYNEEIDSFKIVDIRDKTKLTILNGSFFSLPKKYVRQIQSEDFTYFIRQGYYESANIDLNKQLMDIPITRTMYDANAKAIKIKQRSLNTIIQDSLQNPVSF